MDRNNEYNIITKRLIILLTIPLVFTGVMCFATFKFNCRFMVSWFVMQCGFIGGFVSIEQRLKNADENELSRLSGSWFSLILVPIFGGIFALVLYMMFLAGIIEGRIFPEFYIPEFSQKPIEEDIKKLLIHTYPLQGADFAKLAFWSFMSGFSERFAIGMINRSIENDKG